MAKPVLAQIAASKNLAETLTELVESAGATADPKESLRLTILSNWRASLGDSSLLSVNENRIPTLRLLALRRLMVLPEWDPRYKSSWAKFEGAIRNDQPLAFMR